MKRLLCLSLALCLMVLCLSGCGAEKPVIGIIQFGPHASLNNCYEGIIEGLGQTVDLDQYTIEYVNSNFAAETSLAQAQKLVNEKAAVIVAIATPSAIQAATAAAGSQTPVVYCAVTDASQVANFSNMTGTSDIPDFKAQLGLVTAFFGRSDLKIGVLMSTEESSDAAQLAALTAAASEYKDMSVVSEMVADITTIDVKIDQLLSKEVDCLVNLLDNTVVGKLDQILTKTNAAGVPVFGSEVEQVKAGCVASASIDYLKVGRMAGEQAAAVLQGTPVEQVAQKTLENETALYYSYGNFTKFAQLGLPNLAGLTAVDQ